MTELTIREIMHELSDVNQKIDKILEQTTKHNGRMTRLELWRERITGAGVIIVLVVVPVLAWALLQIAGIDHKVQAGVQQALSFYEKPNQ